MAYKVRLRKTNLSFDGGEWFKFKMSYSGFLKAGNATLSVSETKLNNKEVYHVVGKGWTSGMIKWFFKVKDQYESYFDKNTLVPYKFIRKIDEGGYTKDIEINFDHKVNKAIVNDKKHNVKKEFSYQIKYSRYGVYVLLFTKYYRYR